MGTLGIVRALWKYWAFPNHPLYRYRAGRASPLRDPLVRQLLRLVDQLWRPSLAVLAAFFIFAIGQFVCGANLIANSALLEIMFFFVFGLVGSAIFTFIYLWPVAVAVSASSTIAEERERLTWEILLTTPVEWSDIVLAKLALSQRRLNPYGELLLWVQAVLIVLIFVLIIAAADRRVTLSPIDTFNSLFLLFLVAMGMAEFAVARVQDYVLAGLIGLIASLVGSSRQSAVLIALFGSMTMVLIRALFTAFLITQIEVQEIPAQLILLATGPSSTVVLALQPINPIFAALVLVLMVLLREIAIRVLFRWLVQHLGSTPLVISA